MNKTVQTVKVYTTQPSNIVYKQDTIKTKNNKVKLIVKRQNKHLKFTIHNDSLTKHIELSPRNSFAYWSNIYFNAGIGMLIDKNNSKRYGYQPKIYINEENKNSNYHWYTQPGHKGNILLNLSLPWINSFHLVPENETDKNSIGFWGATIGLDYYYSANRFLELNLTGGADFIVPVPAAVDMSGEYELMSTKYISLTNNYTSKWLTIGYGIVYARNTWDSRYSNRFNPPPPTRKPVKKSSDALGVIFPIYFQTGEHFRIGVVYRPTFYKPDSPKHFLYEHLISIDFGWKIALRR